MEGWIGGKAQGAPPNGKDIIMAKFIMIAAAAAMAVAAPALAEPKKAPAKAQPAKAKPAKVEVDTVTRTIRLPDGRIARVSGRTVAQAPLGCPPGLEKKSPPCTPPGQAKLAAADGVRQGD
jgi:hypothetical protein